MMMSTIPSLSRFLERRRAENVTVPMDDGKPPRARGWRARGDHYVRSDGTVIYRTTEGWQAYFTGKSQISDYVMEGDGDGGDSDRIMVFATVQEAQDYIDRGWPLTAVRRKVGR